MRCVLDHIVIGAASLDEGVAYVRNRLGVDIPRGGKHALMSTHNHLMRLGEDAFFEVISIDPDAPPVARPRWFEMDDPGMRARLANGPGVITWVIRSPDLDATVAASPEPVGAITNATRDALSWRITLPEDGRIPGNGVLPHVIQWDGGARPWERMAERGCRLEALILAHPEPKRIEAALRALGADKIPGVSVERGSDPALTARIVTPTGEVVSLSAPSAPAR